MLRVEPTKLWELVLAPFVKSFTSRNNPFSLRPPADPPPYIYVTLVRYKEMKIDGHGKYDDTVMTFSVPVDYEEFDEHGVPSTTAALIPLYTFVTSDWNFVTQYEVYGRLCFKSSFTAPETTWWTRYQQGPAPLIVSTTLFPTEKEGRLASEGPMLASVGPIVRISSNGPSRQSESKKRDYLGQHGLDMYLDRDRQLHMTHTSIALKQVRNALDPSHADYQSLVSIDTLFTFKDQGRFERVEFGIKNYPGLSAVQNLGIGRSSPKDDGWTTADVEAFTVPIVLMEEQGKELWRRVAGEDGSWVKVPK
jgi:hypothetical protein